jgi:hypothetical protein
MRSINTWQRIYGGTVDDYYGAHFDVGIAGGSATNRYGVYVKGPGTPTDNDYGIYVENTGMTNYFAGKVGIGVTNPTSEFQMDVIQSPQTWQSAANIQHTANGVSGAYNDNVALQIDSTNNVTGAGSSRNYGSAITMITGNDGDDQLIEGSAVWLKAFSGDTATAFGVYDWQGGAGATTYGLYLANDHASQTNWGVYSPSSNVTSYFEGPVGIGTTTPAYDSFQITRNLTSPEGWWEAANINATMAGSSASYSGVVALNLTAQTSATGAGWTESFALTVGAKGTNDSTTQVPYGIYTSVETHDTDIGYGVRIVDQFQGNSTGGTIYGLFINLNDADVTRWGIYQSTNNNNYLRGRSSR